MLHYGKAASILLAGVAAYAAYRFSRMSPEQKKDLTDNLKNQGKKILGKFMPQEKGASATGQHFGEGSQYTS
jgi:hypothetical protein